MAVDKKIRYEDKGPTMQGGVQNYLGKQPQVMAPRNGSLLLINQKQN